jgi:uncharacterized protein YjiK
MLAAGSLVSGQAAPRLGGVNSEGMAMRVDPSAGMAVRLSGVGLGGYSNVQGLTFDETSGTLYGIDPARQELVTIDWQGRRGFPVGGIGVRGVSSLAYDSTRRVLWGVEVVGGANDRLIQIDPETGQSTFIGTIPVADVGGIAFNAGTGILYATDYGTADTLLRLNTSTAQSTVVGPLGFVFVGTLSFHRAGNTLYGVDLQSDRVITINTATGAGTARPSTLGGGGFTDVRGIAVDPASGTMIGMDSATEQLLSIDRTSGAATALGPLGASDLRALAFDPLTRTTWATETRNDKLVRILFGTSSTVTLGSLLDPTGARLYEVFGLAFDPYRTRLYGADRLSRRLLRFDTATGRATSALSLRFADNTLVYGMRALGFDTSARQLYGIDSDGVRSRLLRIDPATGIVTLVGAAYPIPYPNVDGLTYSLHTGLLLASADNNNAAAPARRLLGIQPATGSWSELVPLEVGRLYGLIYDPISQALAGTTGTEVYRIATGGISTALGTLGADMIEGLAWDPLARALYGTTVASASNPVGRLVLVDPASGQGTPFATLRDGAGNGYTAVSGLAFDPGTGRLYGSDTVRDQLVRINRATGVVTVVGNLGFQDVRGLAFHAATSTLYGVDASSDKLLRINTTTGVGTIVGSLGFADPEGLGFDETTGLLYASDSRLLQLYRINTTTGLGTALGSTGYKLDGLDGRIQ